MVLPIRHSVDVPEKEVIHRIDRCTSHNVES